MPPALPAPGPTRRGGRASARLAAGLPRVRALGWSRHEPRPRALGNAFRRRSRYTMGRRGVRRASPQWHRGTAWGAARAQPRPAQDPTMLWAEARPRGPNVEPHAASETGPCFLGRRGFSNRGLCHLPWCSWAGAGLRGHTLAPGTNRAVRRAGAGRGWLDSRTRDRAGLRGRGGLAEAPGKTAWPPASRFAAYQGSGDGHPLGGSETAGGVRTLSTEGHPDRQAPRARSEGESLASALARPSVSGSP